MTEQTPTKRVRVTVKDESYVFDAEEITLTDAYLIKSGSGLNMNPFLNGISEGDPLALQTLVWFCRYKAGVQGDRGQIDFKLGDFDVEPEESPDPTTAGSSSDAVATSDSSPITAT